MSSSQTAQCNVLLYPHISWWSFLYLETWKWIEMSLFFPYKQVYISNSLLIKQNFISLYIYWIVDGIDSSTWALFLNIFNSLTKVISLESSKTYFWKHHKLPAMNGYCGRLQWPHYFVPHPFWWWNVLVMH